MLRRNKKLILSILPLRDIVVFPGMVIPLFVGRDKSIKALEASVSSKQNIVLLTQKSAVQDEPSPENIYRIGVSAKILQILRLPDGTVKVLVEAQERVEVSYYIENPNYFEGEFIRLEDNIKALEDDSALMEALVKSLVESFDEYIKFTPKISSDLLTNLKEINSPIKLVNTIAAHISGNITDKQKLLEEDDLKVRFELLISSIEREIEVLSTERKIRSRIRTQVEKNQKEYYLNEQIKAIRKELGDEEGKDELQEIERKIEEVNLSEEAKEKAKSELKKLKMMNPVSSEAGIVRNYLDWLLSLPWGISKENTKSICEAEKILNADHYGLEKAKERIIEHLSVIERAPNLLGQIICFVGPPGVGKTSLVKSIAEAVDREFIKISLGGVHDESEIRGHRRTYIGSMPGRIIQSFKKVKSDNPIILLDEIDKLGKDFRGDPSAALLEVLDPEQNKKFNDNYLEVDFDLSKVMFIATANSLNLPRPLLDRMEIIRVSGYTEEEKVNIAKQHLIPKLAKKHNLQKNEWKISDAALKNTIAHYTRESGVRGLEREIAKLIRKAIAKIAKGETKSLSVTAKNLASFLGVQKFEHNIADENNRVGVTNGLAYSEVGGDLLPIEAVLIPGGKGNIILTGKLGEVMQESAKAAWSYVRSRCYDFGISKSIFLKNDIHIHVPEGATPKDGPSAGLALATTIISLLTDIAVYRDIAMTGEISLRGNAMPIGGLKEKLLAAVRGDIKKVMIPEKNIKDLEDIPETVKKALNIIAVKNIDDVLKHALISDFKPLADDAVQRDNQLLELPTIASSSLPAQSQNVKIGETGIVKH